MSKRKPGKLQWKANLLVGLLLVAVLYLGVNGIAFRHYWRQNILLGSSYARLSEQTINLLNSLPEPVTIVNFISAGDSPEAQLIGLDLDNLLDEYAYHSRHGKGGVEIRRADPYVNFDEAKRLADEFKLTTQENVLIISYKDRHKVLNYTDLADIDLSLITAGGPARLTAYGWRETTITLPPSAENRPSDSAARDWRTPWRSY